MAKIRREFKNVVYNYTDAEVKVREATSNDPWGPSGTVLSELAEYTYHIQAYSLVMGMLWKRLNDHGKNWRHVYKSLVVLEYLVKSGSQRVVQQCKDNMFSIETLKDFQYIDKDGKDQGTLIREKAKNLSALLKDDQKLEDERVKASKSKGRVTATAGFGSNTESASTRSSRTPDRAGSEGSSTAHKSSTPSGRFEQDHMTQTRPSAKDEEDLQLQLALRMSKEQAEKDEELKKQEEESLKLALELSKQEASGEGETLEEQAHEENDSPEGDDLLGLGDPWSKPPSYEALTTPPNSEDPWVPPPTTAPTDPFGANDPFKTSLPPSSLDPWKAAPVSPPAVTTTQSFGNEFSGPSSNDPWGNNSATVTTTSTAPTDFSTLPPVDIGLSATTGINSTTSSSKDPYDFSAFSVPLVDSVTTSSDNNVDNTKDVQRVEESFLGANAGLVNLDSLIQPLPPPSSINQFGVPSGSSPSMTRSSNPFEGSKTQAPTLQQLQLGGGGGGDGGSIGFDPLPPPLLPGTTTATQPPSNTFNPFS